MNPKHFHTPLSTRARCPVCHEAVYSRAGIHPQCAVRQSDPPKSKAKTPATPGLAVPVPEGAEPLDVFRRYMSVFCREQAYCHLSPALVHNLEVHWHARERGS